MQANNGSSQALSLKRNLNHSVKKISIKSNTYVDLYADYVLHATNVAVPMINTLQKSVLLIS